jgi:uncharacterized protein YdeI (YjbR/CyaY-like superfamily)
MAAVKVDPTHVHEFADAEAFAAWLARQHDKADEVWIKLHKVKSGLPSITPKEAIDVALCWGWIDGIRKSFDANSYLQRYTPRRAKSLWSKVNVDNAERLVSEGRMTEHGLREVEAAKRDGRWERAYAGGRSMELPADLVRAIGADPAAKAMLVKLTAQNRYALAFRLHNLKTAAARERKIGEFVQMLREGRTIYPQRLDR